MTARPRKIIMFYHVAAINDWQKIFACQMAKIKRSGLYDELSEINIGFLGISGEAVFQGDPKIKVIYRSEHTEEGELPTLGALWNKTKNDDFNVLYMHTKGVSRQPRLMFAPNIKQLYRLVRGYFIYNNIIAWRNYMEHFNVFCWKDCCELLKLFDAVGVEWLNAGTLFDGKPVLYGHFSGNFWWSKSEYIRTLQNVSDVDIGECDDVRMKAEYWLGSNYAIKAKSIHNTKLASLYLKNAETACKTCGVRLKH